MSASVHVRAGRAYVEVTAETSQFQRSLSGAQAQLQQFGRTCQSVGKDLLSVSGAMAIPMGMAVKSFAEFDDQMRLVRAVTHATEGDFKSLTETASRLGRETSFTVKAVAEGMTSLGRMGFSSNEIENAIQPTLDLARATGTDLSEAANIAANSMRIFGIDASEMTGVADVLTATANGSAQTLTDLFEALKMAGPQAKAAGENIQDTSAAIGVLANLGIKGSLAGTALRKSFSQFSKERVQETLRSVGVTAVDSNGNLRKMADIMTDIGKVMAHMPSADKIAFAEEIFDVRGSLAGLSLGGNAAELDEFRQTLQDVDGTARETAASMDAGIGGSFRKLSSAVEGAMNAIGGAISVSLQPYVESLTQTFGVVTQWIQAHSEFVTGLAMVTAGVAAFGAVLLVLGTVAKALAATITIVKVAVSGLAKAFAVLKVAMTLIATHPVMATLTALTLVVGGLIVASGGLTQHTAELSDEMQRLREEGDASRKVDDIRMQRLQQLSEKQRLSNTESAEAVKLINALEGKYGDFGASIDATTGKLTLATDAQKRLNDAMRKAEIQELEAESAEIDNNIGELNREQGAIMGAYTNKARDFWSGDWGRSKSLKDVEAVGRKITIELKKLEAVQTRLEALKGGAETPQSEVDTETELRKNLEAEKQKRQVAETDAENAENKVSEIERRLRRDRQTAVENEIEEIITLRDEYKQLIRTMIAFERAKDTPDKAKIAEMETKLAEAQKDAETRKQAVYDRERDAFIDEAARIQEQFDRVGLAAQKRKNTQREDREIDRAFERSDTEGIKFLSGVVARYQSRMLDAKTTFDAALVEAQSDSRISEDEKSNLSRLQNDYSEAHGLMDRYADRLAEASMSTDKAQRGNMNASGSFSVAALQALGQTSAADRTAKATESIAKNTKKTYDVLRKGGSLVFT